MDVLISEFVDAVEISRYIMDKVLYAAYTSTLNSSLETMKRARDLAKGKLLRFCHALFMHYASRGAECVLAMATNAHTHFIYRDFVALCVAIGCNFHEVGIQRIVEAHVASFEAFVGYVITLLHL